MRVILDTNVILQILSKESKYSIILDNLFDGKFDLLISNEILFEYEELITRFYGELVCNQFINFIYLLPNVYFINIFFSLNLIEKDRDDNKFVDCSFSGNADFIVTSDKHFEILNSIEFPKISVCSPKEFLKMF